MDAPSVPVAGVRDLVPGACHCTGPFGCMVLARAVSMRLLPTREGHAGSVVRGRGVPEEGLIPAKKPSWAAWYMPSVKRAMNSCCPRRPWAASHSGVRGHLGDDRGDVCERGRGAGGKRDGTVVRAVPRPRIIAAGARRRPQGLPGHRYRRRAR